MEQLISHVRYAIKDTITYSQISDREVIPVLEVPKLLGNLHDILNKNCLNGLGMQFIFLPFLFLYYLKAACEVWVSPFPFFNMIEDTVPPGEPCLYACITWIPAQVKQQALSGVQKLSSSNWSGKAKSGFHNGHQKMTCYRFWLCIFCILLLIVVRIVGSLPVIKWLSTF